MSKTKVIAFYLPQYHPTKNNNEWWGEGFTEWTNVGKAKKLYPGHYQPKVPADLGYYDLRLAEVRKKQVELAKEAGVTGFCYYHYWFSEGHEELDLPFKQVVECGEPDFPFCLCWANESWYSKFWNKDGTAKKKLLAEQLYPGEKDNEAHFYSLLKAFKDKRYIKVDGKLLFMIYQPFSFENFNSFKRQWNELAIKNGLSGFYFMAQTLEASKVNDILRLGYDGINHCFRLDLYHRLKGRSKIIWYMLNIIKRIIHVPFVISYKKAIEHCVKDVDYFDDVYATMMPNWDHTPRSGSGGSVLHNATPALFKKHAYNILSTAKAKDGDHKMVFLKSWNEWGEGNYMEPDLRYGKGYIKALQEAINEFK